MQEKKIVIKKTLENSTYKEARNNWKVLENIHSEENSEIEIVLSEKLKLLLQKLNPSNSFSPEEKNLKS